MRKTQVTKSPKVYLHKKERETVGSADYVSSLWFVIRPKDVKKLEGLGYSMTKILIPKGYYGIVSSWNETFIVAETWTHCNKKIYYNLKGEKITNPIETPLK